MKQLAIWGGVIGMVAATASVASPTNEELWKLIQKQQAEIEKLKAEQEETEQKVDATADAIESSGGGGLPKSLEWASQMTIGGYGEHHYNNFDNSDDKVDAHRFVLFIGREYSDTVRFFSEFELEHSLAGEGKPGEVELEQAYIEWDYAKNHSFVSGLYLVPVGILNETHEPETFYGVERNLVEKNIIPTTWWETGVLFKGQIAPGLSYDFAMHSGLSGVTGDEGEEVISIRGGRQKSAKATANDFAYTGRLKYTGVPGLEVAATVQLQEDLSQGDDLSDASATLFETHVVYETGMFGFRALYAQWDVDGDIARDSATDEQYGWYVEPSIKPTENLGFFVRYSEWNNTDGALATPAQSEENSVTDYGVSFWLNDHVVFKADYQDAGDYNDNDSVNLGVGWSF